ncbi:hypothetical protein [Streptomyces prasinus]|uniref:hypothetical protein n=1 Tax=Streptomyces prasinus TaxID=67345 RepID=UPI0033A3EBFA
MVTAANPAVAVEPPVVERVTGPLLGPLLAVHLWRTAGTRHRSVLAGLLGLAAAGDAALPLRRAERCSAGRRATLGMSFVVSAPRRPGPAGREVRASEVRGDVTPD